MCWCRIVQMFSVLNSKRTPYQNQLSESQSEYLISQYPDKPLLSIIVPVYKIKAKWLEKCVDSVYRQHYRNWELILIDDASGSQQLTELMHCRALKDKRIRVYALEENSGIAAATNFGIKQARGKFVGFLDHDDELTPDALTWIIWAINKHSHAQWFYSDEDKISENGRCYSPYFKPDFSPELLLANMYTCHLSVYSAEILKEIGGIRQEFEGAQDHDLALRLCEIVPKDKIVHIPRVLYHWRVITGSVATCVGEKPLAPTSGRKAVEQALARRNIQGKVTSNKLSPTLYQVKLEPTRFPKVSILIPTKNAFSLLKKCLVSIREHTKYPDFEIVIIDNNSDDPAILDFFDKREKEKNFRVIKYDKSFNHSDMNNIAVKSVDSEIIVFMNNDIEILSDDWLEQLIATLDMDKSIASVGCMLLYDDHIVQHAGIILGKGNAAGHAHKYTHSNDMGYFGRLQALQEYSGVTAALSVMRKSAFNDIGGFNPKRYPTSFNDADLSIRLGEHGFRSIYNPMVKAIHHESKTRFASKNELGYRKNLIEDYSEILFVDPFYNPNLALNNEQFSGFRQFPVEKQIPELANMPEELL